MTATPRKCSDSIWFYVDQRILIQSASTKRFTSSVDRVFYPFPTMHLQHCYALRSWQQALHTSAIIEDIPEVKLKKLSFGVKKYRTFFLEFMERGNSEYSSLTTLLSQGFIKFLDVLETKTQQVNKPHKPEIVQYNPINFTSHLPPKTHIIDHSKATWKLKQNNHTKKG